MNKLIALPDEVASAMYKTARALGQSGNTYVAQAIVRAIAADSERVSLANTETEDEIARLSADANSLVHLAHRIDGKAASNAS